MSLARYAKKRDANERAVIDALEAAGIAVWQLDRPVDLLAWDGARLFLLEVKMPGAKLTRDQEAFMAHFELTGVAAPVWVVRTPEEAVQAAAEAGQWR